MCNAAQSPHIGRFILVDATARDLEKQIEDAYLRSGNHLGWRLLASPVSVLQGADIAFIGLNPGGSNRPADHPEFCTAGGSAYVTEIWTEKKSPGESRLQLQVRSLFSKLDVEPEKVLAGNLVPFRSPSWEKLNNRTRSLDFGIGIWSDILKRAKPSLVICMGGETFHALSRILDSRDLQKISINWGSIVAKHARFDGGALVGLPHLSRFGIITRSQSEDALKSLFREHWKG